TKTGDASFAMNNLALVTDLATKEHISAADAADKIANAYNGNTKILKQYGVETTNAKEGIAQLGEKLRGTAEGDAKTFGGRFDQLKNQFGEFKEAIGTAIIG